jgi:hypothetical protein
MTMLFLYCKNFAERNIRQVTKEQISVLETNRDITAATLQSYLPTGANFLCNKTEKNESDFSNEREIFTKCDMNMI